MQSLTQIEILRFTPEMVLMEANRHQQCIVHPLIRMHSRIIVIMLLLYQVGTTLKCIVSIWLRITYMLVLLHQPSKTQGVSEVAAPMCDTARYGRAESA